MACHIVLSGCTNSGNELPGRTIQEQEFVSMVQNMIYYDAAKIEDVTISCSNGQSSLLSQEVKNTKMVIYLPELECASCYEMQLQFLEATVTSDIKPQVLIIGRFQNIREQKLFESRSGFTTYRIEKSVSGFPLPMFDESPLTFLLQEDMTGYAFFNAATSKNLSDMYYRFVVERMHRSLNKQ